MAIAWRERDRLSSYGGGMWNITNFRDRMSKTNAMAGNRMCFSL